jgi:hypothetical protein
MIRRRGDALLVYLLVILLDIPSCFEYLTLFRRWTQSSVAFCHGFLNVHGYTLSDLFTEAVMATSTHQWDGGVAYHSVVISQQTGHFAANKIVLRHAV